MQQLDEFTQAYIDCAIWAECHQDSEDLNGKDAEDLAPETLGAMIADCQRFQTKHSALLKSAYMYKLEMNAHEQNTLPDYTPTQAGHDFWLSRNGHGAGFFDRGLGDIGEALQEACGWKTDFPEINLYLGDDGKIYA